jgi:hypothetical protein
VAVLFAHEGHTLNMTKPTVFVAYPSQPEQVGITIEASCKQLNAANLGLNFETWRQIEIPGKFIVDGILDQIDSCEFFVADITRLNFNVTFEIGYRKLAGLYQKDALSSEGDFSERMLLLVNKIAEEFAEKHKSDKLQYLSANEVTQFIYKHDIPKLKSELIDYLILKKQVWILFDNIDKGWPTRGVDATDVIILRALLDGARKLEQSFAKHEIEMHSVVFVRNDVYENLVEGSPDRGKHAKVSLDWTDPDLLREFLRRRITKGNFPPNENFSTVWSAVAQTHVRGEDSSQYLIDRSLMRPRNLLNLVNYAKSNAVNLGHTKITVDDIDKAMESYSSDLANDIGLEIRDVLPEVEDALYYFIGSQTTLKLSDIKFKFSSVGLKEETIIKLIEMFLWFAFFGVANLSNPESEGTFIYNVQYDIKKLKVLAKHLKDDNVAFRIHRSFFPFLQAPDPA